MSAAVGTDIIAVGRVARLIEHGGDAFLRRWFSEAEIAYCRTKASPEVHFAARLAAKEAVLKALRSPWEGPMRWRDIEVVREPDGAPAVELSGRLREQARAAGIAALHLSLSHCESYATATVVAEAAA